MCEYSKFIEPSETRKPLELNQLTSSWTKTTILKNFTASWVCLPHQLEQQTFRAWTWPLWGCCEARCHHVCCHNALVPHWCWLCHKFVPHVEPHVVPHSCRTWCHTSGGTLHATIHATIHATLCATLVATLSATLTSHLVHSLVPSYGVRHILCQQAGVDNSPVNEVREYLSSSISCL